MAFLVVEALWLFVPAYFANMAPVFAMKLFPGWKAPIDGGRLAKDGRRLLGDGKTWRGLIAGILFGATLAVLQAATPLRFDARLSDFAYAEAGLVGPVLFGGFLGLGAIVGDAVKSYFKRRTGRKGGAPWVPFDQLDFVVGGLAFVALGSLLLASLGLTSGSWFAGQFLGGRWPVLVILLVATPLLHLLVNIIGYKLKLKEVPW
jgi:CDP-2,3-bis-(O-geranylgeranyl)-sn-glycerol synthase